MFGFVCSGKFFLWVVLLLIFFIIKLLLICLDWGGSFFIGLFCLMKLLFCVVSLFIDFIVLFLGFVCICWVGFGEFWNIEVDIGRLKLLVFWRSDFLWVGVFWNVFWSWLVFVVGKLIGKLVNGDILRELLIVEDLDINELFIGILDLKGKFLIVCVVIGVIMLLLSIWVWIGCFMIGVFVLCWNIFNKLGCLMLIFWFGFCIVGRFCILLLSWVRVFFLFKFLNFLLFLFSFLLFKVLLRFFILLGCFCLKSFVFKFCIKGIIL